MPALNLAPLSNLLAAVHDAYLQQREAGAARRLRACRVRLPDQPRPRTARRPIEAPQAPQIAPQPIAAPAPATVSPAPASASALPYANLKRKPPRDKLQIFAPTAAQVADKAAYLERHGVTITRNDDGQFSAPELTAWYLDQVRIR